MLSEGGHILFYDCLLNMNADVSLSVCGTELDCCSAYSVFAVNSHTVSD